MLIERIKLVDLRREAGKRGIATISSRRDDADWVLDKYGTQCLGHDKIGTDDEDEAEVQDALAVMAVAGEEQASARIAVAVEEVPVENMRTRVETGHMAALDLVTVEVAVPCSLGE